MKKKIKKIIMDNCKSRNPIIRMIFNIIYNIAVTLIKIKNILLIREAREIWLLKVFHSKDLHQTTPTTGLNRYPQIFFGCREYFSDKSNIKILSFGCSTGEEVVTLRRYFPNATIVGAEINKYCLELCQKKKLDDDIIFIQSTEDNIIANGPYDAVFCMAVFQRTPQLIRGKGITDLNKIYPFYKFEQQISRLDQCIKENGLLIVHFSQYDFQDTEISARYEVYGDYNQDIYCSISPIFNKDGQIIREKCHRNSIFIKKT